MSPRYPSIKTEPALKEFNISNGRILRRHSNEAERANLENYNDFKLKKTLSSHGLCKYISAWWGLKCSKVYFISNICGQF